MSTILEGNIIQHGLVRILDGMNLSQNEARDVMTGIMRGEATPAQIGGLLTALRLKGETVDEITGFAEAMRESSARVITEQSNLLDTCGTGGSGISKFNISTASAIIASSLSVRVAKHGNRSASSKAGSADVLEALGVNIHLNQEQARACLDEIDICFLFAQVYHPSMKYAAAPRKELGVRTVFNLLGPLTNPAGADRQVLGVYDRSRTEAIAESLGRLGLKRALVVASYDGLDEISISDRTKISELKDGSVHTYDIHPDDLGLNVCPLSQVLGGTAVENAEIIKRVFSGESGGYRDIVLANAGASIYVAGLAGSIAEGVHMAKGAIDSGKASRKLQQLIEKTGEYEYVS
ncbi:anthranilate phosphoribosyltransferase [Neobacillus mesonae]|nr:anthranilate phosphoribosyltransferase [Neobacillus mesonae]